MNSCYVFLRFEQRTTMYFSNDVRNDERRTTHTMFQYKLRFPSIFFKMFSIHFCCCSLFPPNHFVQLLTAKVHHSVHCILRDCFINWFFRGLVFFAFTLHRQNMNRKEFFHRHEGNLSYKILSPSARTIIFRSESFAEQSWRLRASRRSSAPNYERAEKHGIVFIRKLLQLKIFTLRRCFEFTRGKRSVDDARHSTDKALWWRFTCAGLPTAAAVFFAASLYLHRCCYVVALPAVPFRAVCWPEEEQCSRASRFSSR